MPIPTDEETETTTSEPLSRRAALEAAMDDVEAGAGETAETEAPVTDPAEADGEPQSAAERARDEAGRFAKAEKAKEDAKETTAAAETSAKAARPAQGAAAAQPGTGAAIPSSASVPAGLRAPQSWKPAVREVFGTLPAEVQAEVLRRERDATRMAQELAQARQAADGFGDALKPYESAIRAQGVEPRQYVSSVLQSAHVIYNGPPQARADALATIIMQAGVPPELLDRALVARMQGGAQMPQAQQVHQQPQQFRDPRLDAYLAQAEQRASQEAEQTAASFGDGREFFEDVREDVADILELWARRGKRDVTQDDLERAYTLACQSSPDVAPVFEQRRAAEQAAKARASTQRARAAGVSLRSTPGASTAAVTPDKASGARVSRREALAQAMEAAESGGGRL